MENGDVQSFAVRAHRGEYRVRGARVDEVLHAKLTAADRLIVDATVAELHPTVMAGAVGTPTMAVVANESLKSLDGVEPVIRWLLNTGFDRGGTIYVIGGGTVQDGASFVASILHRGVRWVFVPTTLLAQGDSCIGSKSSINYGGYKNQLGTFYPPSEVLIDDRFLSTLNPREVRSGVGEMLHYALLGGDAVLAEFERVLTPGWWELTTADMTLLAMDALAVKREYIEDDEFDRGRRRYLNFGHTFGHGLEFASGGTIPHGVAVAYGIAFANAYASEQSRLSAEIREHVDMLIGDLVDGSDLSTVTAAGLLKGMSKDKKRGNNQVDLILLNGLGEPTRVRTSLDHRLETFLQRTLDYWQSGGHAPYRSKRGPSA